MRKDLVLHALNSLQNIWKSNLPRQVKVNVFQTLVEPLFLYGLETRDTTGEKFGWLLYQAFNSSPKHQLEGQGNKRRSVWRPPKNHKES